MTRERGSRATRRSQCPGLGSSPPVPFAASRSGRLVCKVALEVRAASAGMKPLCPPPTLSAPGASAGGAGVQGTPSVQTGPLFRPRYRKPEEGALEGTSCLGQGISSSAPAGGRLFAKPGTRAECGEPYMCNRQVHWLQFIFLFLQKKKIPPRK